MELTWRDVLDSNKQVAGMHINEFLSIVEKSKYDYFTWNGIVFKYYPNLTSVQFNLYEYYLKNRILEIEQDEEKYMNDIKNMIVQYNNKDMSVNDIK
jgi:hypothetical protein